MAEDGPRAYVGMGSNLGDRAAHLLQGVRGMLAAGLRVARLSSVYESHPSVRQAVAVGVPDEQPAYLNMVAELSTPLPPPAELLALLLEIERAEGRRRDRTLAPRTLDLDLLLYGDLQTSSSSLVLPHPRLHLRRFVLVPLAELAPDLMHPTLRRSVAELLAAADEGQTVRPLSP